MPGDKWQMEKRKSGSSPPSFVHITGSGLGGCALTVDLQYFSGLLWCLCECHMVHFAGVGHSIIISVHVQLQRAPHFSCH
ncbi:hypothetical protein EYF80_038628 [Liparis tanakae]|uniref:Uncharacterized protein n=1 Tax=Liparis tanakae TaxID=230148 RepID=A0A4Z2GC72_9TELE|nr:hypothetical protein EYF80_038628 [Liparis tanakae]